MVEWGSVGYGVGELFLLMRARCEGGEVGLELVVWRLMRCGVCVGEYAAR